MDVHRTVRRIGVGPSPASSSESLAAVGGHKAQEGIDRKAGRKPGRKERTSAANKPLRARRKRLRSRTRNVERGSPGDEPGGAQPEGKTLKGARRFYAGNGVELDGAAPSRLTAQVEGRPGLSDAMMRRKSSIVGFNAEGQKHQDGLSGRKLGRRTGRKTLKAGVGVVSEAPGKGHERMRCRKAGSSPTSRP